MSGKQIKDIFHCGHTGETNKLKHPVNSDWPTDGNSDSDLEGKIDLIFIVKISIKQLLSTSLFNTQLDS